MRSAAFRKARLFAWAALGLGILGQGMLSLFLILNGLELWPLQAPDAGANPWLVNAALVLLFAVQHSGMARGFFKQRLQRVLPNHVERPFYVACSGLAALLLVLAWQPLPGSDLWRGPAWISAANLLAVFGIGVCFLWQQPLNFLGVRPFLRGLEQAEEEKLVVSGPYRWVRHPLMLGLLIHLWTHPVMSMTLAFLSGGLTLYILVAIQLEERDLVRKFGQEYQSYRARVPALIPWKMFSS